MIEAVSWDHPDAVALFMVAYDGDGDVAVGCGAVRIIDEHVGEVKRMYVAPDKRGTRGSRRSGRTSARRSRSVTRSG